MTETQLKQLQRYMHPDSFAGMSGKMKMYLAHILGIECEPHVVSMDVTSDGGVSILIDDGDGGENGFESYAELKDNFDRAVSAAAEAIPTSLKPMGYDDIAHAYQLFYGRVSHYAWFAGSPDRRGLAMAEQTDLYWKNKKEGVDAG
jgi:hypothetical protein